MLTKGGRRQGENNLRGINNIKGDVQYQDQIGWFVGKIQGYGPLVC